MKKIKITGIDNIKKQKNNELIVEFDGNIIIEEEDLPLRLRFQNRPLTETEIRYRYLLIKRSTFPEELTYAIPRLGDRIGVIDYKSGMKVYGRIDNRQYRISGLNLIWKKYPGLKKGDIIRMALNPVTRDIIVDFVSSNKNDTEIMEI